jgi:hypothetical protein
MQKIYSVSMIRFPNRLALDAPLPPSSERLTRVRSCGPHLNFEHSASTLGVTPGAVSHPGDGRLAHLLKDLPGMRRHLSKEGKHPSATRGTPHG